MDFLFPATRYAISIFDMSAEFQFRCGFSVPCDNRKRLTATSTYRVSIPLWIFCSLRLNGDFVGFGLGFGFNSVVDFLFPATSAATALTLSRCCFNSVVDFLFPATARVVVTHHSTSRFQFRCGFSVPCDNASCGRWWIPAKTVSIPLWIFCSLRPRPGLMEILLHTRFNSVVDFLFPATAASALVVSQ